MAADRLTQRQIIKGCIGLVSDAALPAPFQSNYFMIGKIV